MWHIKESPINTLEIYQFQRNMRYIFSSAEFQWTEHHNEAALFFWILPGKQAPGQKGYKMTTQWAKRQNEWNLYRMAVDQNLYPTPVYQFTVYIQKAWQKKSPIIGGNSRPIFTTCFPLASHRAALLLDTNWQVPRCKFRQNPMPSTERRLLTRLAQDSRWEHLFRRGTENHRCLCSAILSKASPCGAKNWSDACSQKGLWIFQRKVRFFFAQKELEILDSDFEIELYSS